MPTDAPEGYISSAEACRALGISARTLRRRVQAGEIDGEYVARPQGSVLYVRLPSDVAAPDAAPGGDAPSSTGQDAAQRLAVALETVNRLVAHQAGLVSDTRRLERENGALQAARDAAEARADDLATRLEAAERERDRLARRRWWNPSTW